MLPALIHTAAELLIILTVLKLIELHTLRRNPDSAIGQAIAFLIG